MKFAFLFMAILFNLHAIAEDLTIQTDNANVREGPSPDRKILGSLKKGDKVSPLSLEQSFIEVDVPTQDRRGWLYYPDQGWTLAQVRTALKSADGASAAPDIAWTSIDELGYPRGWMFEGLESGHQQSFRFPLPRAVDVRGAKLRIGFNPVVGLGEHSVLRIDVNGQPVRSASLAQSGMRWIEFPLPNNVIGTRQNGSLDVTLRASMMMSEHRCLDERTTAAFLHISPASGLELDLSPDAGSVLGAWEMLPKRVTLSLPAQPDEQAFASALMLIRQLHREGRQAELVRLPRLGDVIVASASEVQTVIADHPGGVAALEAAGAPGNIRVLKLPERQVLIFSPDNARWPSGLIDSGWLSVAGAGAHDVTLAQAVQPRPLPANLEEVSFARLGADLPPRDVVRSAEWRVPLGIDLVPAGRIPSHMRLIVTSAPVPDAQPMMLYAYVNDELQDVHRLQGGKEQITLHFAKSAVRSVLSDVRLVVQRDIREGNCEMLAVGYPVQISPSSSIVFRADQSAPRDFGALPRHFAGGFDLLLGAEVLAQPESALNFIANLLNANRFPLSAERIRFVRDDGAPSGPFMLLADTAPGVSGQMVRFDRGQVMVRDHEGKGILDMDRLTGITVVQMVDWDGQHGLWVKPPASGALSSAPARELELTFDAAAFIDDKGVALSLSPDQPDIAQIDYPQYRDWFDLFGAYRYWLLALGWIIVVALLAQLYVKVRNHKKIG